VRVDQEDAPMVSSMFYGGNPWRDMRRLQDEVNRLFQSAAAPRTSFPALNVYAHQGGIVITAELPGVKQDQLEITVHRDTVTLRGTRQDEPKDARAYHRRERGRGSFGRTFGLPFPVDADQVEAKLSDGVLILTLQRPEQDKPKRIRISAG
jgi:HSP20 family protein